MNRKRFPSLPRAAVVLYSGLMAACSTVPVETAAPPLNKLQPAPGSAGALAEGRLLYLTRCAKCHQVYPVKNYTAAQWQPIMTEMAEDAKLSASEDAAVRTYIAAALKTPG